MIELSELFSFFQHPQRYFMRRQMDLRFNGMAADAEEREPFSIADLDGYAIYHEWIREMLNGEETIGKKTAGAGPVVVRRAGRAGV